MTKKNKIKSYIAKNILFNLMNKIQIGKITIHDDSRTFIFGGKNSAENYDVQVHVLNGDAYSTVLFEGSAGAGKSYMQGEWYTSDLKKLLEIFMLNTVVFSKIDGFIPKTLSYFRNLERKFINNTLIKAKKNIVAHYDLGNEFFQLILDPTMMYSCALYDQEHATLEEASKNKLSTIAKLLQLKPDDHVLEIGTGWGGLAIFMAQNYGCKVTTTTISDKQYVFVKNKIHELGLASKIKILNLDYRLISGEYDKIVSVEMIEAVGYKYFDTFFKRCNACLRPGGLFLLQAIVINDQSYQRYKDENDFIKKYIFPGGCLPSVARIAKSIESHTDFQLIHFNDIGKNYVKTLMAWLDNFNSNRDKIKQLGFRDDFIRLWEFYFLSCAAAFDVHRISDIHAVWRKL